MSPKNLKPYWNCKGEYLTEIQNGLSIDTSEWFNRPKWISAKNGKVYRICSSIPNKNIRSTIQSRELDLYRANSPSFWRDSAIILQSEMKFHPKKSRERLEAKCTHRLEEVANGISSKRERERERDSQRQVKIFPAMRFLRIHQPTLGDDVQILRWSVPTTWNRAPSLFLHTAEEAP